MGSVLSSDVAAPKVLHLMRLSLLICKTPDRPRRIFTTLLKGGLSGGVLGYVLALLLGRSVWLEMHMNTGLMLPGFALLGMLFSFWRKFNLRYTTFLLLELISATASFLIYRFEWGALLVIPACLLREGCHLTSVSVYTANIILGAVLFAGNLGWILHDACRTDNNSY